MIKDVLEKINLHLKRAKSALNEMKNWESITANIFEDFEKIKTVDTFIYRYTKLQDMMGQKLFRVFLDEIGEYRENMSLLDSLDKLEKLEIIEDANRWREFRNIRNQLTHEYPNSENEYIKIHNSAMLHIFVDLINILPFYFSPFLLSLDQILYYYSKIPIFKMMYIHPCIHSI